VVDSSDVVIAIWDGEPGNGRGGTAEIYDYARRRGVPVVWINALSPADVHAFNLPHVSDSHGDAKLVGEFRHKRVNSRRLEEYRTRQRHDWLKDRQWRYPSLPLVRYADWILLDFARADRLADFYQCWYLRASDIIFSLPAFAIFLVSLNVVFHQSALWAWAEGGALLTLLAVLWLSHRFHVHTRWYTYRFLAERLRSHYFLALALVTYDTSAPAEGGQEEALIRAVTADLAATQPSEPIDEERFEQLRTYLSDVWIDNQAAYHWRTSRSFDRWHFWFRLTTATLFCSAVVAAFVHGAEFFLEKPLSHTKEWVVLLTILIPAVGGAIHGIASQREYHRHSIRYEHMATRLRALRRQMRAAKDLAALQSVAMEVEHAIRQENSAWLGVVRFHDLELVT
jgi:hypothetical protein